MRIATLLAVLGDDVELPISGVAVTSNAVIVEPPSVDGGDHVTVASPDDAPDAVTVLGAAGASGRAKSSVSPPVGTDCHWREVVLEEFEGSSARRFGEASRVPSHAGTETIPVVASVVNIMESPSGHHEMNIDEFGA